MNWQTFAKLSYTIKDGKIVPLFPDGKRPRNIQSLLKGAKGFYRIPINKVKGSPKALKGF